MKLAFRMFVLSVVVAGAAAAATSPKASPAMPSHLSTAESAPIPQCSIHIKCPPDQFQDFNR